MNYSKEAGDEIVETSANCNSPGTSELSRILCRTEKKGETPSKKSQRGFSFVVTFFNLGKETLAFFLELIRKKHKNCLVGAVGPPVCGVRFPSPLTIRPANGPKVTSAGRYLTVFTESVPSPLSVYDKAGTRYLHKAYPPKMSHR